MMPARDREPRHPYPQYDPTMRTVLVIDDNPPVAEALKLLFGLHDIRTLAATSPAEGLGVVARERVDLVIADMNFSADTTSGDEGVALFRALRAAQPDLPVILLTAWTHLEAAVQLVKAGAADYIGKPWDNDKLLATVENLLELSEANRERRRQQEEQRRRRERLAAQYDLRDIVFASDAMERSVELACRVARAEVRVLITGPNGAGKERIAEIVHANSARKDGPFVAVNCGAIPAELIEAELFGAEAGAYTGATRSRTGRFELANGGTLFLDEIGDLPLAGQVKLLRVLETGQFEMLGSSKTRTANVRVISATNADLTALIHEGRFREDLYYRLNVIEIALPPLIERRADIVPLARHFLGAPWQISDDAEAALLAHDWPGNVRELRNSIERAKLLARDNRVSAADLNLPPPQQRGAQHERTHFAGELASPQHIARAERAGSDPRQRGVYTDRAHLENESPRHGAEPARSERFERDPEEPSRELIEASLRESGGNVSRAAQSLGLSRQALYRRMERFNLRS
jgi:DNA-binding NtrC family response regulator